ncbi:acyltransferase family protein [Legionella fairfieldensis]|uniref:acyltransferase family protein n=1 Tax=Legionella fairfieldensis TaxID=45064 RepID=UPI000490FA68|nr:acyltransferase [Legionella fairfieldensis]
MNTVAHVHHERINNFTFLRLMSAVFVIFCHSWDLLRIPNPLGSFIAYSSLQCSLGVLAFFTISGFLVTESYIRHNNFYYYIKARALRIFPGLLVSVLITALVIGPIATSLTLRDYFNSGLTFRYIFQNITLFHLQMNLPGVFENNIFPDAVNGSLWTLPIEFKLYCIVGLVGIIGSFSRKYLRIPLLIVFISAYALSKYSHSSNLITVQAVFSFMLGALVYLLKEKIILSYRILFLSCILFFLSPPQYQAIFSLLGFSYFIFLIAFSRKLSFSFLDKYGDYSYGLYIYAFPVQQLLIHFFPHINPISLFGSSFSITLFLAVFSWFIVEKPALALKGRMRNKIRQTDLLEVSN